MEKIDYYFELQYLIKHFNELPKDFIKKKLVSIVKNMKYVKEKNKVDMQIQNIVKEKTILELSSLIDSREGMSMKDMIIKYLKVTEEELISPKRDAYIVKARQFVSIFYYGLEGYKSNDVAFMLKKCNHTVVLASMKKAKQLIIEDSKYRQDIQNVCKLIGVEWNYFRDKINSKSRNKIII